MQGKIYFIHTRSRWAIACKSYPILIYVNYVWWGGGSGFLSIVKLSLRYLIIFVGYLVDSSHCILTISDVRICR